MSKLWILKEEGGQPRMTDWQKADIADYCKQHPKATFRLEPSKNPVSDEMRGYYYGAVLPFLRTLVPEWEKLSDDNLHEICKKNFNFFEAWNPITKRKERYGQSIMALDRQNQKAMEYLMRIADWVMENYAMSMPDPEDYKRFRDEMA